MRHSAVWISREKKSVLSPFCLFPIAQVPEHFHEAWLPDFTSVSDLIARRINPTITQVVRGSFFFRWKAMTSVTLHQTVVRPCHRFHSCRKVRLHQPTAFLEHGECSHPAKGRPSTSLKRVSIKFTMMSETAGSE